jgi:hypothetical protein
MVGEREGAEEEKTRSRGGQRQRQGQREKERKREREKEKCGYRRVNDLAHRDSSCLLPSLLLPSRFLPFEHDAGWTQDQEKR